jgi:hypothetical protein
MLTGAWRVGKSAGGHCRRDHIGTSPKWKAG